MRKHRAKHVFHYASSALLESFFRDTMKDHIIDRDGHIMRVILTLKKCLNYALRLSKENTLKKFFGNFYNDQRSLGLCHGTIGARYHNQVPIVEDECKLVPVSFLMTGPIIVKIVRNWEGQGTAEEPQHSPFSIFDEFLIG
jgi:hypothetical protein